jgi:esterase/lipase
MKKWINLIKSWFRKRRELKLPVIYCVHGFGIRRTVEFDPLRKYFESKGHQVVCVDLFDQLNEKDDDPQVWFSRAELGLKNLSAQKRKIWLVGFSMGGVIATKLASIYPVERVVLLAPAFEYLSLQTVINVAEKVARRVTNKPKVIPTNYPALPDHFTLTFRKIVLMCKDAIDDVDVPVLFLHGSDDEVIPVRSSQNAYVKLAHPKKLLMVIEGVNHRLLDDEYHNQDLFKIIECFFKKQIIKED